MSMTDLRQNEAKMKKLRRTFILILCMAVGIDILIGDTAAIAFLVAFGIFNYFHYFFH